MTFQPREKDGPNRISAYLSEDDARASLEDPRHKGFGLCVLDIETLIAETDGAAWVEFDAGSHVRIYGCDDEYVQLILATISEVLIEPAKPYRIRGQDT